MTLAGKGLQGFKNLTGTSSKGDASGSATDKQTTQPIKIRTSKIGTECKIIILIPQNF